MGIADLALGAAPIAGGALLFTIIWWNVSHSRANWLVMFIVMIIVSVVAGIYAGRGLLRAVAHFMHKRGASE